MTLGSMIVTFSWAMGEALQGAVLLLGVLVCLSTLYLLLVRLSNVIRRRIQAAEVTGEEGA